MLFRVTMPIYSIFITASAYILKTATDSLFLLISMFLFIVASFSGKQSILRSIMELISLCLLQYFSGLSWTFTLYLLLAGKHYYNVEYFKNALYLFLPYCVIYTLIELINLDGSTKSWLMILLSIIIFITTACVCQYFFRTEKQQRILSHENDHLATHDLLTGLINFDEYHTQLEKLLTTDKIIMLVLIDCTDLKSMNNDQGFEGGNRVLKQISDLLKITFSDALMLARYGGDEFAIALEIKGDQRMPALLMDLLDSELPMLTGIQLTYGTAIYPIDGSVKDELILVAEKNLFSMKRAIWLKREEHMLRSEKLRIVGELASGMAHELRNPLTTVKGFLQISRSNGYNIQPWYSLVMDEISRMSELTAEFLQFSKPHATNFREQALEMCINRVISLMETEAIRLGHQLLFEQNDASLSIHMDQDKMVQLLLNLVKNAFESMGNSGMVKIRLSRLNNHALVEIQDSGRGIPEEEMDKIFHPFYTTKDNGTGLGLSICHKIVQDHEGLMEVISVPNEGTTFRIILPVAK